MILVIYAPQSPQALFDLGSSLQQVFDYREVHASERGSNRKATPEESASGLAKVALHI